MTIYTDTGIQDLTGTRRKDLAATGQFEVTKIITEYESGAPSTTSAAGSGLVDAKIWSNTTGIKANSKLEFFYYVPGRNDSSSWGGGYIEPNISFDNGSTWAGLGHGGYDGGCMNVGFSDIHTYNNLIWIDPGKTSDFSVRFKFRIGSYDGTYQINGGNVPNYTVWVGHNMANAIAGSNQMYMHYILKVWTPVS